jgi:hypothetical protein
VCGVGLKEPSQILWRTVHVSSREKGDGSGLLVCMAWQEVQRLSCLYSFIHLFMQVVRDLLLLPTPPKKVTHFVLPVLLARRKFHCADISGVCLGPSRSPAARVQKHSKQLLIDSLPGKKSFFVHQAEQRGITACSWSMGRKHILSPRISATSQGACLFKDSLYPLQGGSQAAAAMIKESRVQTQPGVVLC